MTTAGTPASDTTIDSLSSATAFLRRSTRFWGTALTVLFAGTIACAIFLFLRRPVYRSETVILYSENIRLGEETERPGTARSAMARLKEILMSRASLDTIVRELDLYSDVRQTHGPVDAVEELRKHIEFRAPGGDTFSLAFVGTSPSEARAVTARLAQVVLDQDSDLRKTQAVKLREFLEAERRNTEIGLRDAELALASFMAAHPRFALDTTPLATGAAIRASLKAGTPQAATPPVAYGARTAKQRAPEAAAAISVTTPSEIPSAAKEALAEQERAKAALAAARASLTELAARFTPAHPDVRAAEAEVERASRRLAAATAAVAAAEGPVDTARPTIQDAPLPLLSLAGPAPAASPSGPRPGPAAATGAGLATRPANAPDGDVVELETEWVKLTRATTEAREHEDLVETALFKARSAANSETGDRAVQVAVIDPAFLPRSAMPPGRATIAAVFAGVSLLLAAAAAAVRARVDDRIFEAREVEPLGTLLAAVPRRSHASRR